MEGRGCIPGNKRGSIRVETSVRPRKCVCVYVMFSRRGAVADAARGRKRTRTPRLCVCVCVCVCVCLCVCVCACMCVFSW